MDCFRRVLFAAAIRQLASNYVISRSRTERAILLRALGPLTAAATISGVDQARLPDPSSFIFDKTDGDL
jgi:hypothetical protein